MKKLYFPLPSDMYRKMIVTDDQVDDFLSDGWFSSIADHKASLQEKPKPKARAKRVKASRKGAE